MQTTVALAYRVLAREYIATDFALFPRSAREHNTRPLRGQRGRATLSVVKRVPTRSVGTSDYFGAKMASAMQALFKRRSDRRRLWAAFREAAA